MNTLQASKQKSTIHLLLIEVWVIGAFLPSHIAHFSLEKEKKTHHLEYMTKFSEINSLIKE